ncbi:MAG TPA: hypothetical protein VMT85_18365 [Thermoanaerobaculia bacterium]|nr:hypothetical protein [Thermoanaerobaculia bacterium]
MTPPRPRDRRSRTTAVAALLCAAVGAGIAAAQVVDGPLRVASVQGSGQSSGPDVTVISLQDTANYGALGDLQAYSVGTTSCNVGDQPVWWCDDDREYCEDTQHPVIAQNLYRLKDGRFEQLGASWLKHGFFSVNQTNASCGASCGPTLGGDQLGVGCTDPYSASLNGNRSYLGPRSEVNGATGLFPFPPTQPPAPQVIDQRLQVTRSDLDPALNQGALYWVEGHYVAADDAAAGNGLNNASYRRVTVAAGTLDLSLTGSTFREQPAIAAWPAVDPEVELMTVDTQYGPLPTERFHVARKVTGLGDGTYHYEYAVHNLNSNRGARALVVTFPGPTPITDVGFRDVDSHSGEPYDTTDWETAVSADSVTWFTDTCDVAPNANALRWGTMYSFWFDASRPPAGIVHSLDLFEVLEPETILFEFPGVLLTEGFESGDAGRFEQNPSN